MLPFDDLDLDNLDRLADACLMQMATGHGDWPGKPCRQRLELFLATSPDVVKRLVRLAREGQCRNGV
jgi:hypothetical protein